MSQTSFLENKRWLDGRLQYNCLDNDGREAEVIAYHSNGQLRFKYPIKGGQINGIGRIWYDDGTLECEEEYCNGRLSGVRRGWHKNGKLEIEVFYMHGLRHGICRIWYEDGTLRSTSSYVSGNLNGIWKIWHPNGILSWQCNYQNGRLHGVSRRWHISGDLRSTEVHVRGIKVPVNIGDLIISRKLTAKDILGVKNAAVRRLCLEELGYARFLSQMPHTIIEKDGDCELVMIDWLKREEPICLVKVKCPSTGAFYTLRVPPKMKTVKKAVAWTFHLDEKDYNPESEA